MKNFFNLIKNPKLKMIYILTFLLFIYISVSAISYAQTVSSGIANNVFRLHVIANSDSVEDQNLKYKVRDELIEYMKSLSSNYSNKQEAILVAKEHINDFKQIALNVINKEGFNYDVNIDIGNFQFPTKNYGDITFPSGFYDALKVQIGNAKGQNWWCVMFPPLCFVDINSGIVPEESKENLKNNLTEEEFALISDNKSNEIEFKFKLLEFFTNNGILTAKK